MHRLMRGCGVLLARSGTRQGVTHVERVESGSGQMSGVCRTQWRVSMSTRRVVVLTTTIADWGSQID